MEKKSWVEGEVIKQEDRPDRKVYHITPAGRNELREWLSAPLPPTNVRNAELIQVFFAVQLEDEEIIALLEQQAANLRAMIDLNQELENPFGPHAEATSPRDLFFWNLTFENGMVVVESQLAWLESVIERIRSGQVPPQTSTGGS